MTLGRAPAPWPHPGSTDFPVVWERPSDEQLFWSNDRMHFPTRCRSWLTLARLSSAGLRPAPRRTTACRSRATPGASAATSTRPRWRRSAAGADGGPGQDRRGAIGARSAASSEPGTASGCPRSRQHIADWRAYDLAGAPRDGAAGPPRRDRRARRAALGDPLPAGLPDAARDQPVRRLLPRPVRRRGRVPGVPAAPGLRRTRPGVEPGALGAEPPGASPIPTVRQVFETLAAGEIIAALEASAAGRAFLAELRRSWTSTGGAATAWTCALAELDRGPDAGASGT